MRLLSVIFYFLSYHSMLAMPVIILFFAFVGAFLAQLSKQKAWYLLVIPSLLIAPINVFFGHFLNAGFLNVAGVEGTGVIVHSRQTDDMLNNQWVWEYNVVFKISACCVHPVLFLERNIIVRDFGRLAVIIGGS